MDIKTKKIKAVDSFLEELNKKDGKTVLCPVCKTKLELSYKSMSYIVHCQTKDCLIDVFRGI